MCHFITAVLPPSAQSAAVAELFRRHGRKLQSLENASIQAQLQPGEAYFATTLGSCDCGTGLGASLRAGRSRRRSSLESQMNLLREKGWSEPKVARWLQQHDEQQMTRSMQGDLRGGVKDWVALLEDVLVSGRTASVGLLLHSYRGPLGETIKLKDRKAVPLQAINALALGSIEEDVLYVFATSAGDGASSSRAKDVP